MHTSEPPADAARVLVVIVNRPRDLEIVRQAGWYRVPLAHVPQHFAADYLAFYQTRAFADERWAIRYYAQVLRYRIATRQELLPDEAQHPRAAEHYYRVELGPLQQLPLPLPAARLRRITFIATSYGQLRQATDVRDLFLPDPAAPADDDDDLWGAGLAGRSIC
jgi:hypothetical protein